MAKKQTKMIKNICVISFPSDSIVPYKYSCDLAKQLKAKLITVENSGHFIVHCIYNTWKPMVQYG